MAPLSIYEQQIDNALRGIESATERQVLKNYKIALDQIRSDMTALYEKHAKKGVLTYAEMTKYNRLNNLEKRLDKVLLPTFGKNNRTIDKLNSNIYEESFFRHGWAMNQATRIDLKWGLLSEQQIEEAVKNPLEKIALTRLKADGRIRIKRAVTQGLIRGLSYPQMSKEITGAINGNASDAMRIVRTEGQRAAVMGQQASYEEAIDKGVQLEQIWDATLDGRTRPAHGRLDGRAATNKGTAENPHWQWYTPGIGWIDGPLRSGYASFDIHCRCRIRGQIKGFEPILRRTREKGIEPYQTYRAWQKGRKT